MRSKRKIALPRVKNPRRLINWAQNALILLLVAGAVILAAGPSGFGVGTELRPEGAFAREEYVSPEYGAAAEPMCIVVTPEEGVHDAALYSSRDLSDAYRAYSAALAEALGSAGEPVEVDAATWERAISSSGVYFDYYTDCQLSSFAIWLGSEMTSSAAAHTARRLCLALEDGSVALYYMRARQGTWYRCDTELNYSELAGRVAESGPDGASFVFEHDGKYEGVDPYWVIASGQTEVRTIAGEDSVSGSAERIMEAFGMNSMLAQDYYEADGTQVCLEGGATLRLGAAGTLRFTRSSLPERSAVLSPSDAVELTRGILEETVGLESGVAVLRLSSIYCTDPERGDYVLRYDYAVDGLTVSIQGRECAAEFRISGGTVYSADMICRAYSYTGGAERPLPASLTATLVAADGGGEPRLAYIDTFGAVRADWIVL